MSSLLVDFTLQVAWTHLDAVPPRPESPWQSLSARSPLHMGSATCMLSDASVKQELTSLGCVAPRSSHGQMLALKSDKSYISYGYHTEQNTSVDMDVNAECARAFY